jgi:hypothetical protein
MTLPKGVQLPDVLAVEGGWRMYYRDAARLWSAVSDDGVTWRDPYDYGFDAESASALLVGGETWVYYKTPWFEGDP